MRRTVRWARRMSGMKASAVREILKVTERPEVVSFAGGLPAAELFPVEALAQAQAKVLAREGRAALQYSTTEGYGPLRGQIARFMASRGAAVTPERLLITNGSQQGIDLVCKVLLDPGDAVVVENPSYLAALQVFAGYEAHLAVVGSDAEGMRVDELAPVLRARRPKLIYLTPTFQNPKGTTLTLERRRRLVALAQAHGALVLEDDPYSELRFRGEGVPSVLSLAPEGVVYLSTFSKILSPGLRLGWMAAPPELLQAVTVAKQAADLHTSTLLQRTVACLLETFDLEAHIRKIRSVYGERCDAMLSSLAQRFPSGTQWTCPEGGLFTWVKLPGRARAEALLRAALEQGVAFVPGAAFFAARPRHDYLRLNFSNRPPDVIRDGMARIAAALRVAKAA